MIEGFVFYKSFADAVDALPAEQYKTIVQAVCHYAIYGEEPEGLDAVSFALYTLMKPQIDANNKRREAGRVGGSKHIEAKAKQNEATLKQIEANVSKGEANAKQNEAKEKEKDKVKEKINKEKDALDARGYTGELRGAVERWLEYRRKIRKPYADLEGFLDKIDEDRKAHGNAYVVEEVAYSIQQGYQGLFAEKKPVARSGTTNFSNERKFDPSIETLLLGES